MRSLNISTLPCTSLTISVADSCKASSSCSGNSSMRASISARVCFRMFLEISRTWVRIVLLISVRVIDRENFVGPGTAAAAAAAASMALTVLGAMLSKYTKIGFCWEDEGNPPALALPPTLPPTLPLADGSLNIDRRLIWDSFEQTDAASDASALRCRRPACHIVDRRSDSFLQYWRSLANEASERSLCKSESLKERRFKQGWSSASSSGIFTSMKVPFQYTW
mmetsp:Transcript_119494/g.345520  ORF Transcript_119494/g.345520 Transcript_119494/m.345520 type:complete len:223 (+) Transcript_119494:1366-2034(+)